MAFLGPDRLATVGEDGALILWDLAPATLQAKACQLAGRNLTRTEWDQYLDGPYHPTCPQWPKG